MKRLSLYVFYEKNGRLRDSDKYYLKGLKAVSEPAVIVNGHISEDGLEFLNREGYSVLCRNNIGFDFAAWKEYFEKNPDECEETFVYFPITAPYSPLSDSPNATDGLAIKKQEE